MPRIPRRYEEQALDLLRSVKGEKATIDGSELQTVKRLLYAVKALEPPKVTLAGYVVVSFERDDMGNASVGLPYEFGDHRGDPKTPHASFVEWLLTEGVKLAKRSLPDDEDEAEDEDHGET